MFYIMFHQRLVPELLSQLLSQLLHDCMAVILNPLEGGQVAVLLQHTAGAPVEAHRLSIGLQLQTLVQSSRQFEQELELPQQSVDPWGKISSGKKQKPKKNIFLV